MVKVIHTIREIDYDFSMDSFTRESQVWFMLKCARAFLDKEEPFPNLGGVRSEIVVVFLGGLHAPAPAHAGKASPLFDPYTTLSRSVSKCVINVPYSHRTAELVNLSLNPEGVNGDDAELTDLVFVFHPVDDLCRPTLLDDISHSLPLSGKDSPGHRVDSLDWHFLLDIIWWTAGKGTVAKNVAFVGLPPALRVGDSVVDPAVVFRNYLDQVRRLVGTGTCVKFMSVEEYTSIPNVDAAFEMDRLPLPIPADL